MRCKIFGEGKVINFGAGTNESDETRTKLLKVFRIFYFTCMFKVFLTVAYIMAYYSLFKS